MSTSPTAALGFAPDDDRVDNARLLLTSLIQRQPDPLERLVGICALAHLEAHDPPRRPLPQVHDEVDVSLDDVVEALVDVVRQHEAPSERSRAALALQELTTPLHPVGQDR